MSFHNPGIVNNPLTVSLYVEDYAYLAAPTPPGSEELVGNDDEILLGNDGEILTTN